MIGKTFKLHLDPYDIPFLYRPTHRSIIRGRWHGLKLMIDSDRKFVKFDGDYEIDEEELTSEAAPGDWDTAIRLAFDIMNADQTGSHAIMVTTTELMLLRSCVNNILIDSVAVNYFGYHKVDFPPASSIAILTELERRLFTRMNAIATRNVSEIKARMKEHPLEK